MTLIECLQELRARGYERVEGRDGETGERIEASTEEALGEVGDLAGEFSLQDEAVVEDWSCGTDAPEMHVVIWRGYPPRPTVWERLFRDRDCVG